MLLYKILKIIEKIIDYLNEILYTIIIIVFLSSICYAIHLEIFNRDTLIFILLHIRDGLLIIWSVLKHSLLIFKSIFKKLIIKFIKFIIKILRDIFGR